MSNLLLLFSFWSLLAGVIFDVIIAGLCIVTVLFGWIGGIRIPRVFKFRRDLIHAIGEVNNAELEALRPLVMNSLSLRECERRLATQADLNERRWTWFDSVSYNEMAYKFWKPLDSFYSPMPMLEDEEWPEEIVLHLDGDANLQN